MASNFLGEVGGSNQASAILSAPAVASREGVDLQKSMNYRDDGQGLSVFLVLPRGEGFRDEWHPETQEYIFEGHDSNTVEGGQEIDQLLMYGSGRLSENGKFVKAANAYKDGAQKEPLQIQVYEKLDPGVWYDKGIFNLMDANVVDEKGRKVFKFILTLADAEFYAAGDPDTIERMLPAAVKAETWQRDRGRCSECGIEFGLRFMGKGEDVHLRCTAHSGRKVSLL